MKDMVHPQKHDNPKVSSDVESNRVSSQITVSSSHEKINVVDESLTQPPITFDDDHQDEIILHRAPHGTSRRARYENTIGSPPLARVPCGPHPSQIRVTSPRHNGSLPTTGTINDDDDDESEDLTRKPPKPVVLVLPSSPKKPQPIMNEFTHSPHTNTAAASSLSLPVFLYTSPLNSLQQLLTTLPSLPAQLPSQSSPGPVLHINNNNQNNDCDYDHSPTELHQLIEQKQWTRILQKFDAAEHDDDDYDETDDSIRGEPTPTSLYTTQPRRGSIRQQASQWMVRKESNGRLKWRILPLHAAIIFRAPHAVVEAILQCDANSARQKDDQGMIPLHLAMKNFNLQYNNHHHSSSAGIASQYHSKATSSTTTTTSSLVDTITTLWRTVEELLTAYPAGIFSRDRKGRTPLQLGLRTVQKNYDVINNNSRGGISRQTIALRQQQQEMMLAALSVLERYETIYSTAMRDQTSTATGAHVMVPPPSSSQLNKNVSVGAPSMDAGIVSDKVQRDQHPHHHHHHHHQHENTATILSIQQQHLETLQTLRTMFQKQRDDDVAKYERQQIAIQQQLNDSVHRERQLQIELENTKRQLQELQSQSSNRESNDRM